MPDDAELLCRYAETDSEPAFAEFVGRHIDLVYSAALRQVGGDTHRAHDVAQIVFATAARKARLLAGHPVPAAWLYSTTRHVARRTEILRWRDAGDCADRRDSRAGNDDLPGIEIATSLPLSAILRTTARTDAARGEVASAVRTAQERLERARQEQRKAAQALAALPAESATPATAPRRPRTMSEIIANHPELELLELARQRAAVSQDYGRLFGQLGLSPEQIAEFHENQVRMAEDQMDFKAVARAQDEPGRMAAAKLQTQLTNERETALAELLGPAGYRQFQQYNRTLAAHNVVVRSLAGIAALEGVPLSTIQGESLLAATAAVSRRTTPRGEVDLQAIDWDALDAQARQILSPAQFALFKSVEAPAGFLGRWKYELDAAIDRAHETERGRTKTRIAR